MGKLRLKSRVSPLVEVALRELPKLEKSMNQAEREYHYHRSQWRSAVEIVEAHKRQHRAKVKTLPINEAVSTPKPTPGGRAPRRLVYKHVDEVLKEGKPYKQLALRAEIHKRFEIEYGNSSIYRALDKGRKEGRYKLEESEWSTV